MTDFRRQHASSNNCDCPICNCKEAIKKGDKEAVRKLIADGMDVNTIHEHGRTILFFAIREGRRKICEMLIEAGADVNIQADSCRTPLIHAMLFSESNYNEGEFDQVGIIKLLLKSGADMNVIDKCGTTALKVAKKCLEIYEKQGCEKSKKDYRKIVEILEKENPLNGKEYTFNEKEDKNYKYSICWQKVVTEQKSHIEIYKAAVTGDLKKIKALVKEGCDIDGLYNGNTLLMYAAYNGHLEVVKYLVKNGAESINCRSRTTTDTALIIAVKKGDLEMVEFLVDNGADINIRDHEKENALAHAIKGNHTGIIKYLIGVIEFYYREDDDQTMDDTMQRYADTCQSKGCELAELQKYYK